MNTTNSDSFVPVKNGNGMRVQKFTWQDLQDAVDAFQIPEQLLRYRWYAVSRGALPFATMLAVKYNKRLGVIEPFRVSEPNDTYEQWLAPPLSTGRSSILIIDDVICSKRTQDAVYYILRSSYFSGECRWLCLVKSECFTPDFYILDGSEVYYEFPWEPNGE